MMIRLLEHANEKLNFEKLMCLPPELRMRAYELYCSAFGEALETPTQLPLARTSQVMR